MAGVIQLIANRQDPNQIRDAVERLPSLDVVIDTSSYSGTDTELAWRSLSAKTAHWVHLSSAAVYKETPGRAPNEADSIGGAAAWADYGKEKSAADELLLHFSHRTSVTILRPPYLYGPGNDNDRETFVWSRCLRNEPVIVPGDGSTPIQFLHAADLAAIIIKVLQEPSSGARVMNVAEGIEVSLASWVGLVAQAGGFNDPGILAGCSSNKFKPREYFPFRDYPCRLDTRKIRSELGWKASIPLSDQQTFLTYDLEQLRKSSAQSPAEKEIYNTF